MSYLIDITGKKYGMLTVVKKDNSVHRSKTMWICKCDCGNEISVLGSNLKKGTSKSCGCLRATNLAGKRYGRLLVKSRAENRQTSGGRQLVMWNCVCDCGNEIVVKADSLKSGNTKSCGCLNRDETILRNSKHNKTGTRIHHIWYAMKQRCYYSKMSHYKSYGGRGITVCDEWLGEHGFERFYEWAMSHGYDDSLTIDRINVNGNYEPINCRWITYQEQAFNRTDNKILTYHGISKTLEEWSRELGIKRHLIDYRLNKGWDVEKTFDYLLSNKNKLI